MIKQILSIMIKQNNEENLILKFHNNLNYSTNIYNILLIMQRSYYHLKLTILNNISNHPTRCIIFNSSSQSQTINNLS